MLATTGQFVAAPQPPMCDLVAGLLGLALGVAVVVGAGRLQARWPMPVPAPPNWTNFNGWVFLGCLFIFGSLLYFAQSVGFFPRLPLSTICG